MIFGLVRKSELDSVMEMYKSLSSSYHKLWASNLELLKDYNLVRAELKKHKRNRDANGRYIKN